MNKKCAKEGVNRTEKSEENPSFLLRRPLQGEGDTVKETGEETSCRHIEETSRKNDKLQINAQG